jgi:pre-mRNA-splicing factor ATP-dependent RNA helicase DHX15/PRP43
MLLRETMIDKELQKYSIVIIDEVHERSLNSDTLLAYIKNLLSENKDLKLIIMSATLSLHKFSTYLNTKNIIKVNGRSFPIEVYNSLEEQKSYIVINNI